MQERHDRQRDDYKELQQRYRSLSQEFDRVRAEAQLQDTKQQSEWKIERLTKDNRALEVANTELRKELQDVKGENLEVRAWVAVALCLVRRLPGLPAAVHAYGGGRIAGAMGRPRCA